MAWIKDAYLDVLVLLLIVVFAFFTNEILRVVLWVYTLLLLLGKTIALFMPSLQRKADQAEVPQYIYHIIYGLSIGVLLYMQEYYLGSTWILVWGLSFYAASTSENK